MAKIIIDQFIKDESDSLEKELGLECIEIEPEFSYLVKIERKISKGKTETKISYRDTRINMDYKIIHETDKKEEYKKFVRFFKKEGFYKL